MRKYCLALDLKNDVQLIAEYEQHHKTIWPEIRESILSSGIISMEIYRTGSRLFMILETQDSFSFEAKNSADKANLAVQRWETLMWSYQKALPGAKPGEKWILMDKMFEL